MDKEDMETAATATQAVGELIKSAGDSPEAKEASRNIGSAAVTITAALNNCLLPIAAVNFGFTKAREYFGSFFQRDIAEATSEIPSEALIEPKPSLAGPALQGLAFCHDEADLKVLYLKLLATSMDSRNASQAHPAFVEMLRQLTAKEAKILRSILPAIRIPICQIQRASADGGSILLMNHVVSWVDSADKPLQEPGFPVMIDNWIRLGLIEVDYTRQLTNPTAYSWTTERPEFLLLKDLHAGFNVEPNKGILTVTDFGKQFSIAVGIASHLSA